MFIIFSFTVLILKNPLQLIMLLTAIQYYMQNSYIAIDLVEKKKKRKYRIKRILYKWRIIKQ